MTRDEVNDGFDGLEDDLRAGFDRLEDALRAGFDRLSRRLTIMIWYLGVHVAFYAGTTVFLVILLFREGVF